MSDDKQRASDMVTQLYATTGRLIAEPDPKTQRELEDKFLDIDGLVCVMAPDGPPELYDEWTRLRKLMTPEFRRKRDQIHGVVNDDYEPELKA